MVIRTKNDAVELISNFESLTPYDEQGNKHYLVFADGKRNGQWTIMRYENGSFTRHGRGNTYCDSGEESLEKEELYKFIWLERKQVNAALKQSVQPV